jgi:light-regulated signal transduction histidine kinase (bacteriophytochrome)
MRDRAGVPPSFRFVHARIIRPLATSSTRQVASLAEERDRAFACHDPGLAICHRIIERHGGAIWLDESPEPGTSVVFNLPLTSSQQQAPE